MSTPASGPKDVLVTCVRADGREHLLWCSLGFFVHFRIFRRSVKHVNCRLRDSPALRQGASGPGSHLRSCCVFSNEWSQVCVADTECQDFLLQGAWRNPSLEAEAACSVLKKACLCLPSKGCHMANVGGTEAVTTGLSPPAAF